MNNQKYKFTGNQVPIKLDELLVHAYKQLSLFDKGMIKDNPYIKPIVYKTSAGKMIQVPKNIQESAIKQWTEKKQHTPEQPEVSQPKKEKIKIKNNTWMYYVCIIIALIISYYAVKR